MVVFVIKVVPVFLGFSSIFEKFGLGSSDTGGHPKNGTGRTSYPDGNDHGVGTAAVGWIGDFTGAITGNPLIEMFVIVSFVGLGVGLIRRLIRL